MHSSIFVEVSVLLALCAGVAMIMRALRQPLIIGYILTGLIVGPSLLGLIESPETIEVLGTFGVALLLFIVGLGLNPKVVKEVGKISLLTGVGQVLFTSIIGFFLVRALGYAPLTSFYIAVALTFSSTIIILKLLTDKREQNKLFGKISIGFLLVQDIIATFALLIASAAGQGGFGFSELGKLALEGTLLVIALFVVAHFIVKPLTNFLSRTQEMLFLFSLAWGFGVATIFYELGFSLEVGALFAGISLSTMAYAHEAGSRLRPLRDFFIVVFFIALGAKLQIQDMQAVIWQALGLSAFVLIGNPIIVMIIMGAMGYTKRTSFKAGLAVAQISEFSLIFMLLGFRNGQVSNEAVSLVTLIGIITIALSSYMIIYSDSLYKTLERSLRLFERKKVKREREQHENFEALLFGYQRGGSEFTKVFSGISKKYLVVDYDPEAIDDLERKRIPYIYGDVTDPELLEEINFEHVKLVVSAMTDHSTNIFLLKQVEKRNPNIVIICHADSVHEAVELYGLGASFVVMPHVIGNEKISAFIKKNGFKKSEFKKYKQRHVAYLQSHFEEAIDS